MLPVQGRVRFHTHTVNSDLDSSPYSIPHSDRAFQHIRTLAERHPTTKFVSIVGDKCIPNLPDARIPMLIIYRNGEVLNQIVSWGADRERRVEGKNVPLYSLLEHRH